MVDKIYPKELQLNKTNNSDNEPQFPDLNLSVSNGIISTKMYGKRLSDIVNFPFLDGDVSRAASCGIYNSQLIHFSSASSQVNDFNNRNKSLTAKLLKQGILYRKLRTLLKQGYRYHKLLKHFLSFIEFMSEYNVILKTILEEGLSKV